MEELVRYGEGVLRQQEETVLALAGVMVLVLYMRVNAHVRKTFLNL